MTVGHHRSRHKYPQIHMDNQMIIMDPHHQNMSGYLFQYSYYAKLLIFPGYLSWDPPSFGRHVLSLLHVSAYGGNTEVTHTHTYMYIYIYIYILYTRKGIDSRYIYTIGMYTSVHIFDFKHRSGVFDAVLDTGIVLTLLTLDSLSRRGLACPCFLRFICHTIQVPGPHRVLQ